MTTREEAVAMMEWLRYVGAIGNGCEDDEGGEGHLHHPESCDEEYREYIVEFEILLRNNDITEHVYWAIRQAARLRWREVYGEGLDGPVMAARCIGPFPIVEVVERKRAPRRWWWPFRRRKPDRTALVPPIERPEVVKVFGWKDSP